MANVESYSSDSETIGVASKIKNSSANSSMSISEHDVFVDLGALQDWSSQLKSINEESISQLKLMISTVESLEDSWKGNFATGFIDDCSKMLNDLQKTHNEMNNLSSLLIETANIESEL